MYIRDGYPVDRGMRSKCPTVHAQLSSQTGLAAGAVNVEGEQISPYQAVFSPSTQRV